MILQETLLISSFYFSISYGQQHYHAWMSNYAHVANVASMFTGELKPHMRDAFPTLSKCRLMSASLSAHHVIGHLRICTCCKHKLFTQTHRSLLIMNQCQRMHHQNMRMTENLDLELMTVIGNQQFLWNQKINYHKRGTLFISFTNPYCFISIGYNRCLTIFKMRSLYSSTVLKQTHSVIDISLFYTSHQSVNTQVHQLLWSDEIYVIVFRRSVRYSFSHQIRSWLWRHKYPLTECSFSLLLFFWVSKSFSLL